MIDLVLNIVGHQLHHLVVRPLDNHSLLVVSYSQQTHEADHPAQPTAALSPARGIRDKDLCSTHVWQQRLHVRLDFGHAPFPYLLEIFLQNQRERGLLSIHPAHHILLLRDLLESLLQHPHHVIGTLQRASRRHRHINIEPVGIHLSSLLRRGRERQEQGREKKDECPEDGRPWMAHACF